MTEEEWESSLNPALLLDQIRCTGEQRKFRLFACACASRIIDLLLVESSRTAIAVAERFADGLASPEERAEAFTSALREAAGWTNCCGPLDSAISYSTASAAFTAAQETSMEEEAVATGERVRDVLIMAEAQHPELWPAPLHVAVLDAALAASTAADGWASAQSPGWDDGPEFRQDWESIVMVAGGQRAAKIVPSNFRANSIADVDALRERVLQDENRAQCCLLRDIFGNPFRPVTFDPAWRTSTAVGVAEAIYADRTFGNLPILADALQDAGCDHPDILSHLRGPGPHVRGCWVVDHVLGKA